MSVQLWTHRSQLRLPPASQLTAEQHANNEMKLFCLLSLTHIYASSLFPGTLTSSAKLSPVNDCRAFNLNFEPTGRMLCLLHRGEARAVGGFRSFTAQIGYLNLCCSHTSKRTGKRANAHIHPHGVGVCARAVPGGTHQSAVGPSPPVKIKYETPFIIQGGLIYWPLSDGLCNGETVERSVSLAGLVTPKKNIM